MISAGIDAGSRTMKAVLWNRVEKRIVASAVADQGIDQDALARSLFDRLLDENAIQRESVRAIVATGYGRKLVSFADRAVTEITCQRWGVRRQTPEARTIVDIGGQDSKLIRLDEYGGVAEFSMNDRCAAGTGRFLEVVATRLGAKIDALGRLAAESQSPAHISSMCVVFAETEIVGLLASGVSPHDIVAGVQASIAGRVAAMSARSVESPIVFTGDVALVPGMTEALAAAFQQPVAVVPKPQITAALGAALLAAGEGDGRVAGH
ncbi:MAG TPA: 2-hydroxyglutaryl-CoA dehydratase [Planctomycetaceae bacterium]|nr:2-hydroxyglutaryl-CoA dehydratase [Planctomycetaceae bacterium]